MYGIWTLWWQVFRSVWKELWKAYATIQEQLRELYHPSSEGSFALFAVYEGIITHKIVLVYMTVWKHA
jgi:hypothetical protein